jgi:hypothetical protein
MAARPGKKREVKQRRSKVKKVAGGKPHADRRFHQTAAAPRQSGV